MRVRVRAVSLSLVLRSTVQWESGSALVQSLVLLSTVHWSGSALFQSLVLLSTVQWSGSAVSVSCAAINSSVGVRIRTVSQSLVLLSTVQWACGSVLFHSLLFCYQQFSGSAGLQCFTVSCAAINSSVRERVSAVSQSLVVLSTFQWACGSSVFHSLLCCYQHFSGSAGLQCFTVSCAAINSSVEWVRCFSLLCCYQQFRGRAGPRCFTVSCAAVMILLIMILFL